MKAYVLQGINDYHLEEVDNPKLTADSVLLEVKSAGICGSDIPRIYTAGTYSYPLIPGHEFSGIVKDVASAVNKNWIGKKVGVFPLIPCKQCSPCKKQQYEMCQHYSYLGSRTDGGFAELVRVPVWNLIELPEHVSCEQAAMLEPMAVAVHAIRKSHFEGSDTVAVCGLGTIGMFIVMFLKEMGCKKILCIGNKQFQKDSLKELQVPEDDYCDSKMQNVEDWILQKTDGNGVDLYFECVGRQETITQALSCTVAGGKIQLVGNPAGDMTFPKAEYWKILRKQLSVFGTWNSTFTHSEEDDWHYVLKKLEEGKIHPEKMITHRFAMDELMKGFELMRDKREDYIKVMACIYLNFLDN